MKKIMEITKLAPSECNCSECQKQCQTPCLGTPDDILRLIKAGYTDQLSISSWEVGRILGFLDESVVMVQITTKNGHCAFFQDGKCAIHTLGLKPTEGKLSHHCSKNIIEIPKNMADVIHNTIVFHNSLTWNVAREWLQPENLVTVMATLSVYKFLSKV